MGPDSGSRRWTPPGFDGVLHPPFGGPGGPDGPPQTHGRPGGRRPEGMDRRGGGGRPGGRKWLQRLFRRLDRDGNGVITKDEFHGRPGLFERLDQNADGRINPNEARKAMKRRAGGKRKPKNGPPENGRRDRPRRGPPNA
ncbi:MAG: EF-hand domain-containing protein [Phycisphaerae bacterium]